MLFQDADFQKLLLLHSRDRRFQKLRQDVKELPEELTRMEKKIAVEKESVELALAEWKGLESENNSLEKEILSMNDSINRQRNKQLEVKKNEEYQALENEIANLLAKIEERENEQIEILLKIDGARETAELAQGKITERVAEMERQRDERAQQGEEKKTELLEEKVNQDDELVSKMSEISISERIKNIKSVEPSEDASESESSSSVAWPSSESSSHFITPRSSDTFKKHTLSAIILKIEKKRRAKK